MRRLRAHFNNRIKDEHNRSGWYSNVVSQKQLIRALSDQCLIDMEKYDIRDWSAPTPRLARRPVISEEQWIVLVQKALLKAARNLGAKLK